MGWDGMGWDGMGWDGMGWDGMGWVRGTWNAPSEQECAACALRPQIGQAHERHHHARPLSQSTLEPCGSALHPNTIPAEREGLLCSPPALPVAYCNARQQSQRLFCAI
jgi:hypothetical protein